MLCGDGVQGCHGLIESNDAPTVRRLMQYIMDSRPDTMAYLMVRFGPVSATDWIRRQMS